MHQENLTHSGTHWESPVGDLLHKLTHQLWWWQGYKYDFSIWMMTTEQTMCQSHPPLLSKCEYLDTLCMWTALSADTLCLSPPLSSPPSTLSTSLPTCFHWAAYLAWANASRHSVTRILNTVTVQSVITVRNAWHLQEILCHFPF
jgi:hypothetical protein